MQIHLADITEDGLERSGQYQPSLFDLPEDDPIQPTGPLTYDLTLTKDDGTIFIDGEIEAHFQLQCVRCLKPVPLTLQLDDFSTEVETEGADSIDLAEVLREEVLLALPAYPHCSDGDGNPPECEAPGPLHYESKNVTAAAADIANPNVWAALDEIDKTPS